MLATDGILLALFAVFLGPIVVKGRDGYRRHTDTVVMRSIPGLIIGGSVFGVLAAGIAMGGLWLIIGNPLQPTETFLGPVHSWVMGAVGLGLGGIIAFPAVVLFAKARLLRAGGVVIVAPPAPDAAPVARVVDLAAARRSALRRITPSATVDQLAATARDFLRAAYGSPPADVPAQWQPLLDRFDAARFGGVTVDPTSLAADLRALVGE